MKYFTSAFANFSHNGRITRKEFWMFYLFALIFLFASVLLVGVLYSFWPNVQWKLIGIIYTLILCVVLWPMQVKRLHDSGRSGWWIFITAIPRIGPIVLIIFLCTSTEMRDNKYGPIPVSMRPDDYVPQTYRPKQVSEKITLPPEIRFCRNCGNKLKGKNNYCSNCGTQVLKGG